MCLCIELMDPETNPCRYLVPRVLGFIWCNVIYKCEYSLHIVLNSVNRYLLCHKYGLRQIQRLSGIFVGVCTWLSHCPKVSFLGRYLFHEPEAWGSHHYIIVGPDQPSAYLTKSPKLYNDAHSAFSIELLVQEDALREIVLLSKLDSCL